MHDLYYDILSIVEGCRYCKLPPDRCPDWCKDFVKAEIREITERADEGGYNLHCMHSESELGCRR